MIGETKVTPHNGDKSRTLLSDLPLCFTVQIPYHFTLVRSEIPLVRTMVELEKKKSDPLGKQNPNGPPPTSISDTKQDINSSIVIDESHSMDGVGFRNPSPSIRSGEVLTSGEVLEVSMRSQGVGPEQIIHESFVETFSRLFTLDPKESFKYMQTMKDKLTKFSELFTSNGLMNTFLFSYNEGATTTGRVRNEINCKDYKTARRYLAILVDIIPDFIVEDIIIPEEEEFIYKVKKTQVYRFAWSTQDPVLNYFREVKTKIDQRRQRKEPSIPSETKVDPRIAILNLEQEIRVINDWLADPRHKKSAEKFQLAQKELMLKRIEELKQEGES